MPQPFEYDVALSFAGEDRAYVSQVASILKSRGIALFFDEFDRAKLWGKDLYEYLDEIYRKKARYCVIFISVNYANKLWTSHERKSAQARAFQSNEEYILPARFDDTEIPGIRPTVGYIDLTRLTPEQFSELIVQKLGEKPEAQERATSATRDSTKVQVFFNPTPFIKATLKEIEQAAKEATISKINPRYLRTIHFPASLSNGFFERTPDSLLYQKQRGSSIKDEMRQESFRISSDGSFQWIDSYRLSSDKYHLFNTDYLAEQLIYSFIFGRRWLHSLSAQLKHTWQEVSIGIHASIPRGAIIFDQQRIINTKLEHGQFNEPSGKAEGITRLPFKDLNDIVAIGKNVARLMDYIVNAFEFEFGRQKGFASVDENTVCLLVQAYEKEIDK